MTAGLQPAPGCLLGHRPRLSPGSHQRGRKLRLKVPCLKKTAAWKISKWSLLLLRRNLWKIRMMNGWNKKISLQYVKSSEPLLKLIRLTFIFAYGLIYSGLMPSEEKKCVQFPAPHTVHHCVQYKWQMINNHVQVNPTSS